MSSPPIHCTETVGSQEPGNELHKSRDVMTVARERKRERERSEFGNSNHIYEYQEEPVLGLRFGMRGGKWDGYGGNVLN